MKNLFLTLVTILTTTLVNSQNNIWVKIPSYETKKLEVNQTLSNFDITETKKAFPSSRNEELLQVYEITCNCNVNDLIQFTSKNSLFVNPETGPQYHILDTPNDYSIYGTDWALNSINAEGAWSFTHGDSSVVIAITDANYYTYHEELSTKVDWITTNNTNTNYSHGTAVAITAAGNTNNSTGKSSIGWNSRLQLRVMSYNEMLQASYSGAKIINASWVASCTYNSYAQLVIDEVYNNGSIVVASAGNGSTCGGASNLVYPASLNHVISVSSIGPMDNHQRFIGDANSTHQHNSMVDLVAPGYDVLLSTSPGQYVTGNGTSFASPYVSGTIALMLSVNKCLTPDNIEWILKQSADSTIYNINQSYIGQLGSGKLNAEKAVEMAKKFKTFDAEIFESVNCVENLREATINNISGQTPLTYNWSNGETAHKINTDSTRSFWVEVTDNRGCKFFQEKIITKYNQIQIQSVIENVKCEGMNNGEITIYSNGGDGLLSYLWSNNTHQSEINNLVADDYTVVITDESGCEKIENFTITQPEKLETSLTSIQPTESNLGMIDLNVIGGVEPYEYIWNNGETTEDLNNIVANFYEVLVTDANGCMSSENVNLENQINTSSINDMSMNGVKVYPNPSNGLVNIEFEKQTDANLYNASGKLVKKIEGMYETINIEQSGVYYLSFQNVFRKIVIN